MAHIGISIHLREGEEYRTQVRREAYYLTTNDFTIFVNNVATVEELISSLQILREKIAVQFKEDIAKY